MARRNVKRCARLIIEWRYGVQARWSDDPGEPLVVLPYNQIVRGKHATSGLAVACDRSDLTTMAEHALLRWGAKERGRQN